MSIIIELPRTILRLQYQVARFPLQLIENQLAERMHSEAPARLFWERSLGTLDSTVGSLLGDTALSARGSALANRSDELARAARLDAAATAKLEQADDELAATREEVIEERADAAESKDRVIMETRRAAAQRKVEAINNAEQRTAEAQQRADDIAARRNTAIESAQREDEAQADADKQIVTAASKATLDDAADKRSAAVDKRTRAVELEDLADAEKANRKG